MRALLILVLAASSVLCQMPGRPVASPLWTYLGVSADQMATINRLNRAFAQYVSQKGQRAAQVQAELREEMARQTLDAMGIGVRHVELEGIQREITAERTKTAEALQAVLTAEQKAKLAALREVLRLYPIACEAVANNLLTTPQQPAQGAVLRDPVPGVAALMVGAPACAGVAPMRTGNFIGMPAGPRP